MITLLRTAVHKRNTSRALVQDLGMVTGVDWLEDFTRILRGREEF